MSNIQELEKLKELLDKGVLTQDEFEQKKRMLLSDSVFDANSQSDNEPISEGEKTVKKSTNNAALKRIGIIVGVLVILICAVFVGKGIVQHNQQNSREAALEAGIQPIMRDYGISNYAVKNVGNADHPAYHVYAEGFESLTNGEALECLIALDGVSVDDPCGDGKLEFYRAEVHPGMDVEYSYWRVTSHVVRFNILNGSYPQTAGIYCNRTGSDRCVYECKNE